MQGAKSLVVKGATVVGGGIKAVGVATGLGTAGVVVVAVVLVGGAVAIGVHVANKKKTVTRTIADVKAKEPNKKDKVYQYAYISVHGGLIKVLPKMTFAQIRAELAIIDDPKSKGHDIKNNYPKLWGVYTYNQVHAKILAITLGWFKKPEYHSDGFYPHYHDGKHKFHIWFSGKKKL